MINDIARSYEMTVSNLISRTTGAISSAGSIAAGSLQKAIGAGSGARDTVVGVGTSAVDLGVSAKDAVINTAEAVVGYAAVAMGIGLMSVQILSVVGIVVAAIVAPVPTFIGITLIELMVIASASSLERVDGELEARKIARANGRIIDKLAKYGTIPATALIETPSASLRLDTASGTISGRVKTGVFSKRNVEEMSEAELETFASETDEETAKLISAYLSFRATQAA
jgi:hypothetical protein